MSKKRIYVAGPISRGDLLHNVRQADEAFHALAKRGFAPMNPMWSVYAGHADQDTDGDVYAYGTPMSGLDLSHEDWLGIDLEWVAVSHGVLRLPGDSVGADREVAHAQALGIPVYYHVEDVQ